MIELCQEKDCTGCGACYNICPKQAITMQADKEGFLRPHIDPDKCISCSLCQKVCPPLNPVHKYPRINHPIAAISKERESLLKSSSGGMFSLLADWIFARNGVVYGVVMDAENHIYHAIAKNSQELAPMRSSKYAQSNMGTVYRSVKTNLTHDQYVLFSGTPCQVAGLLNYLGKTNRDKLLTVDLVCHGTPSNKMFIVYLQKLASYLKIDYHSMKNFSFRQEAVWGITPRFEVDNEVRLLSGRENLYMHLFLAGKLHRPCCYTCPYTTPERISDITIADFWGIGEQHPFAYDTSAGCSLVLPNSEKGRQVFDDICPNLNYEQREWEEALKYNDQLYRQSHLPEDRAQAIDALFKYSLRKTYNMFFYPWTMRLRHRIGRVLRILHLRR